MNQNRAIKVSSLIATMSLAITGILSAGTTLPDPDGKPADMSKPVQVYILMGQSNMVGAGKVQGDQEGSLAHAVQEKNKYPYLVDDDGKWTERKDVRYVRVMNKRQFNNEWMSIEGDGKIGPEFGIGNQLGHAVDAPVLILKSCIGNRCLGFDLLPPGSEEFEFEEKGKTMVHAAYEGFGIWEKGTKGPTSGWYAGTQYDADVEAAKRVLKQLDKHYPGARGYEVAGFFWWQGDKDRYRDVWADRYEANLVQLIKALRMDFDAPNAKFVCATLGQTKKGAGGNEGKILDAMFAVGDAAKHPDLKGAVATVYTHPISMGGSSNGHYNGHAETYMNVGEAMGEAMVKLLGRE
jgi:hypothetical protein